MTLFGPPPPETLSARGEKMHIHIDPTLRFRAGFVRIPAKLDTDSTPSWTRIPEQAGQSERSDAGFWCFTLRMPSGSSFQSVSADADWLFQRLNRSAAQSYPRPAARLRSLYSRLAGGRRWVTRRTCGEGHGGMDSGRPRPASSLRTSAFGHEPPLAMPTKFSSQVSAG